MLNGAYERMKPSKFIDEIPDELCDKKLLKSYDDMFQDDDYGDSDIFGGGARRFGAKSGRSGGYGSGSGSYGAGSSYGSRGGGGSSSSYGGGYGSGSYGGRSGAYGSGSGSSAGANSYGLQGMGSAGYLAKSGAGAARKKGAGIPKSLIQTGIQKLETLDYAVGDRVKHIKFGEGTVEAIEDGKKDYMVTVIFDTAGQKKMLASFAKLQKL